MTDRLADTLAALERGEKPPCIYCGGVLISTSSYTTNDHVVPVYTWSCGTEIDGTCENDIGVNVGDVCKDNQIAAQDSVVRDLKAERDRLREALKKFGQHSHFCDERWCDCGLSSALRAEGGEDGEAKA